MRAMVLAAGFGTRLRPLTERRAKPACPVAGRPLIHFPLARLAAAGVTHAVLNTHHLPETVRAAVGEKPFGLDVEFIHEQTILGTGGGLKHARDRLPDDAFLLLNGDTISEADPAALLADHLAHDAPATLALLDDPRCAHYGAIEVDEAGCVVDIAGLLGRKGVRRGLFIGMHALRRDIFAAMPPDDFFCIVRETYLPLLREKPGAVRATFVDGRFFDLGRPVDLLAANSALLREPGAFSFIRDGLTARAEGVWISPFAAVDETAQLHGPLIVAPHAQVGAHAVVGPETTVGAGAIVAPHSRLERCLVWEKTPVDGAFADEILTPDHRVRAHG
ncbi:MAG TPA: NDP-sugar synthase [bacterium]|nr:NDP-sugar synthase [bacterium]